MENTQEGQGQPATETVEGDPREYDDKRPPKQKMNSLQKLTWGTVSLASLTYIIKTILCGCT